MDKDKTFSPIDHRVPYQCELAEWVVCGRMIGKASGWDQDDTFAITLYDFEPAEGCKLPASEALHIHFEHGVVTTFNDDGEEKTSMDLIGAIGHLPVSRI